MYRVNMKKQTPVTFVDILTPVKQWSIHFITEFCWIMYENDKIMLVSTETTPQCSERSLHR